MLCFFCKFAGNYLDFCFSTYCCNNRPYYIQLLLVQMHLLCKTPKGPVRVTSYKSLIYVILATIINESLVWNKYICL